MLSPCELLFIAKQGCEMSMTYTRPFRLPKTPSLVYTQTTNSEKLGSVNKQIVNLSRRLSDLSADL
jgi:hypothetical protein